MPNSTPVIVGVADVKNKSVDINDAREPMELMLDAIHQAIDDTGISNGNTQQIAQAIDSIDVVATWTWPYPDLPGLLAEKLGAKPDHTHYSNHGGNQPAKLLDDAARRIASGHSKLAVITGGEALASLNAFVAAKKFPPATWTPTGQDMKSVFSPTTRQLEGNIGATHSIGAPIHVYPLLENGFRAHRNQSLEENTRESADLYASFAKIAEQHHTAWNYGKPAPSSEYIGTPSAKNRMICFPYPLLMNAFNTVNLSAACLLTSTEHARALGIPEDRWIYPLGGAGTADSPEFWERPNFYYSPSVSRSLDAALEVTGLSVQQIDLFDFYSCFPIVPKLACHHLGLPINGGEKPISLLGGLTSFGGAGNNYSMHALTTMVRELRNGNGKTGLVLANGGVMTYQHVVCLSRQPPRDGSPYPSENPLPDYVDDFQVPDVDEVADGEAAIETYTVEFARDGLPKRGYVVGRLRSSGHRFIANHADDHTLQQLASTSIEPIGRTGLVKQDSSTGRNLFSFKSGLKLAELAVWIAGWNDLGVGVLILQIQGPVTAQQSQATHLLMIAGLLYTWVFSTGGYYAIRPARMHSSIFEGIVIQGGGAHFMFKSSWLDHVDHLEYPFDLAGALAVKFRYVSDLEGVSVVKTEALEKYSLLHNGILDRPKGLGSTRLLLVHGVDEEIFPSDDHLLLFKHGDPEEVRLVPDSKHMGEPAAFVIVLEWLYKLMGLHGKDVKLQLKKIPFQPKYSSR